MYQLFANEDEDLQRVIRDCVDTGLTRIEMRFEARSFREADYYRDQLEVQYWNFIASGAPISLSIKCQLDSITEKISNCLLFIEEQSQTYYVAWYKNTAYQNQIYGIRYNDRSHFFEGDTNKENK